MRKWLLEALTPCLCGLLLLLSLVMLGRVARAALLDRASYTLAFDDLECQPPEGLSRPEFLREVRTRSYQPAQLRLLDKDLLARLHAAFAAHPWVESVRGVVIEKPSSSSHPAKARLRIHVAYRRPVLAVRLVNTTRSHYGSELVSNDSATESPSTPLTRVVDGRGVLLPTTTVDSRLPLLTSILSTPTRSPGSAWRDPGVVAAAATIAFLQPHFSQLQLESCEVELVQGEIVLRTPGVRIVWGHAPGQEQDGEAPAKVKLQRLLEYQTGHEGLECLEHDVRLLAYQGHFPLSPARP
jgi:hypothetical protein